MPLDDFQKEIQEIIRNNRTVSSPFAGGSVIQYHGIRLSDDQDIFTADDPDPIMRLDIQALEAAGLTVRVTKSRTGFRECLVMKPEVASATLQWTKALNLEYFAPVPDEDFGQRLHFVDLAVNKILAAADRRVERDFYDLWMLDKYVMPLWRMACASSGKLPEYGPLAIIENLSQNRVLTFSRNENQSSLLFTVDLPRGEPTRGLRVAINKARKLLPLIPASWLGKLQLCKNDRPVLDAEPVPTGEGSWVIPEQGGALPTFKGVDDMMVSSLIAEFGKYGIQPTRSIDLDAENDDNPFKIPDPFAPPTSHDS